MPVGRVALLQEAQGTTGSIIWQNLPQVKSESPEAAWGAGLSLGAGSPVNLEISRDPESRGWGDPKCSRSQKGGEAAHLVQHPVLPVAKCPQGLGNGDRLLLALEVLQEYKDPAGSGKWPT